ncbi:MAG: cold shock domain-containing protein [Bacteroidales bacterium]|nr:cold shock domain-containing protein [Bacteroidales bacterium]
MNRGKVKWYNAIKGFGFIVAENGDDIFLHRTGLQNPNADVQTGRDVVFEIKQGEKGLVAVNVKFED